jgi:hypothetical protein
VPMTCTGVTSDDRKWKVKVLVLYRNHGQLSVVDTYVSGGVGGYFKHNVAIRRVACCSYDTDFGNLVLMEIFVLKVQSECNENTRLPMRSQGAIVRLCTRMLQLPAI